MSTLNAEGKMALAPNLDAMAQNIIYNSHWLPIVRTAKSGCLHKAHTLHIVSCVDFQLDESAKNTTNISPVVRQAVYGGHHMYTFPVTSFIYFMYILHLVLCITMGYTIFPWYMSLRPYLV